MKEENKIQLLETNNQGDETEDKKSDEIDIKEILPKEKEEKDEANKDKNQPKKDDTKNEKVKDKVDNETKELISKEEKEEKKSLVAIIDRLKVDLDSVEYESLNQIYEQYLNNEDITKRNIKKGTTRKALIIMYYIIAPAFSIINLLGVFQSISIMKILFQIIKNAL